MHQGRVDAAAAVLRPHIKVLMGRVAFMANTNRPGGGGSAARRKISPPSPHLNSGFSFRCATSAVSSTTCPRDALTSTASGFIRRSRSRFIRWCVALSRLQCRLTTCRGRGGRDRQDCRERRNEQRRGDDSPMQNIYVHTVQLSLLCSFITYICLLEHLLHRRQTLAVHGRLPVVPE